MHNSNSSVVVCIKMNFILCNETVLTADVRFSKTTKFLMRIRPEYVRSMFDTTWIAIGMMPGVSL
jgi:hypothetical protein